MISKNLFFKLMREDLKRRLWSIVLLLLVFFFALPVVAAMAPSAYRGFLEPVFLTEHMLNSVCSTLGATSPFLNVIMIGAAVLLAISGFHYLHVPKMCDFYHSQPVSRKMQFAVVYTDGVIIYAVTYLLGVLAALTVLNVGTLPGCGMVTATNLFYGYFVLLLEFLAFYSMAVIAVVLTGKVFSAICGIGVLYGFVPGVIMLVSWLMRYFMSTWNERNIEHVLYRVRFLSPAAAWFYNYEMLDKSSDTTLRVTPLAAGDITLLLLMSLVFTAIAFALHCIRPSESAGKTMAFRKTQPWLKLLLMVPGSFASGLFFSEIGGGRAWFVFGILCGTLLIGCFLEILYHTDIRAAFHGSGILLAGTAIAMLLYGALDGDWFGYDYRLPKKDKVESVSIDFNFDYWAADGLNRNLEFSYDYKLDEARYYDLDKVWPLLEHVSQREGDNQSGKNIYYGIEVAYHKKNGSTEYRSYSLDYSDPETEAYVAQIYDDPAYREQYYAICFDAFRSKLHDVRVSGEIGSEGLADVSLTKAFLDIYREELMQVGLHTILWDSPRYTVELYSGNGTLLYYPVYAECEKTIRFLEEHMNLTALQKDFSVVYVEFFDSSQQKTRRYNCWDDPEIIERISERLTLEYVDGRYTNSGKYRFGLSYMREQAEGCFWVQGVLQIGSDAAAQGSKPKDWDTENYDYLISKYYEDPMEYYALYGISYFEGMLPMNFDK